MQRKIFSLRRHSSLCCPDRVSARFALRRVPRAALSAAQPIALSQTPYFATHIQIQTSNSPC
jgi:hypothetical protein